MVIKYPLCARASPSSSQTSIAISRQTGNAALYRAVPSFTVVDAPSIESILSNAASVFSDHDNAPRFCSVRESVVPVCNFLAISSKIFLESDVSFCWNANSPSVALNRASASSLSMLTVNKRWLKSNIFSSTLSKRFFTLSNSWMRDEHAQRFNWASLFAQNSSMQL